MPYNTRPTYSGGYQRSAYTNAPRNNNARTAQGNSTTLTSTGTTLQNEQAGKFLNFNYWGRYANVEIGSVQPGVQMTWEVRKNAQKLLQNLTYSDLSELWDVCEDVLESIKNTGTFTSTSIRVGTNSDSLLEINNGSSIGNAPGIYLVIYKNLDPGNRTTNMEVYPFDVSRSYKDYDHNSGMLKEEISKTGQFKKFYRQVKEAAKAFTMAQAHTIAAIKHTDKLATFKALAAISAKLGVDIAADLTTAKSGSTTAYRKQSYNGNQYGSVQSTYQNSYQQPQAQASLSNIDDPVDINLSMADISNMDMSQFK